MRKRVVAQGGKPGPGHFLERKRGTVEEVSGKRGRFRWSIAGKISGGACYNIWRGEVWRPQKGSLVEIPDKEKGSPEKTDCTILTKKEIKRLTRERVAGSQGGKKYQ